MKYFIIAGEASGDLHASNLMHELKNQDTKADFLCLGGDLMAQQGGRLVRHYHDMAFMGFVVVLQNLRKILTNFKYTKLAIQDYKPDVVILIDYPSFNLKIARFVKKNLPQTPVIYYIPPKLWAWKTYRIKSIKKYIDTVYTIFPFETDFYKQYDYDVKYVGNPTADLIAHCTTQHQTFENFTRANGFSSKPIIALLPGSREQEIMHCLPKMLQAAGSFTDYQIIISGAPCITSDFYKNIANSTPVIMGQTYELLQQAQAAIVNSGTATLETALIGTPQVIVYHVYAGRLLNLVKGIMFKIKHFSLVNIIAQKEVVKEMIAHLFTVENVQNELQRILFDTAYRQQMKQDYANIKQLLGHQEAAIHVAEDIYKTLINKHSK